MRYFGDVYIAVVVISLPTLAAWFIFPKKSRSVPDMAVKGAVVVASTMTIGPMLFMPIAVMAAPEDFGHIKGLLEFWFYSMLGGNMLTALAIWPIRVFLSFLHAELSDIAATK